MRKPAPLRLDSTYNGEEEEEKRNGMAPRADNEQQPDEDDGGKVRDKADRRVLSLCSKTGLGAVDCYPTITLFHTPITKLRAEFPPHNRPAPRAKRGSKCRLYGGTATITSSRWQRTFATFDGLAADVLSHSLTLRIRSSTSPRRHPASTGEVSKCLIYTRCAPYKVRLPS